MADARRSVSDEFEKEESTPNSESEVDPRSTSFINLIVDLSENIVTDSQDFRNLISMCRHNNYIPEGQMEKIKGPLDLFEELMSRDVVNHRSDGLNVLKHLIHKSTNGNFDLIEKIQQFEDDSSTTPSSSSASSSASSSSSSSPSTQRKLMHKSTDGYLDMIKMIKQFESLYLSSTSTTPSSVSSPSFVSSSSVSSSSSSTQTIMAEHNYNCIHRNPRLPSPTVLTWKLDLPDRFVLFDPRIDSASISFTWKWNSMDGNNSRIINPHRNLQLLSPLTIIKSMNTLISGNHFDRRGLSKFGLFIVNELIISSPGVNNMFNLQGNPNEDSSSLDSFTNKVNFTMKRNINKNPDATLSPNIITREVDLMDFVDICEEEMDLFHIIFEDWWIIPYLFGFGGDSRPLIWREERMVKFLKARAKKDTEEKLVANKRL